jgi:uncharacterized protein (TIGR00255 family)
LKKKARMIQSMMGYGSGQAENENLSISIEIKSLNSKFLDIFCRIPKAYSEKEIEIRNQLTQHLERGKIEFTLNATSKQILKASTTINKPLLKAYFNDLKENADLLGVDASSMALFSQALLLPNVFNTEALDENKLAEENKLIQDALQKAIKKVKEFRTQEGLNTELKFADYVANIEKLLNEISENDPARMIYVRERLNKAVSDIVSNENFDQNRFEQELVYFIEKYDISEEKVRLKNHIDYFKEELNKASNGKKLNFIAQEMGREINTIGSKANDVTIQKLVVQMKDELEKIKEQTMNII